MSSFGNEASLERVRSKRLERLFEAYSDIIDDIRVADLNQEIIRARNSLLGVQADESVQGMSRIDLAHRLGLVKNGTSRDSSGVDLPQAFINLVKDDRVVERDFLGHF